MTQIRASAGAGKTWQLTSDYIRLLNEVARGKTSGLASLASTILAVTFTNAAANEMRSRVLERLKETALGSGDDALQARRWMDTFLKEPAALNIRTIDSLLHQIVRASALDLGIPPDYGIEFSVESALSPYLDSFLESARQPGPEQNLLWKACFAVLDSSSGGFLAGGKIMKPLLKILEDCVRGEFDDLSSLEEIDAARQALGLAVSKAASHFLNLADQHKWRSKTNRNSIASYESGNPFPARLSTVFAKSTGELFKDAPCGPELEAAWQELLGRAADYYCGQVILERGRRMKPFVDLANRVAENFRAGQAEEGLVLQALVPALASSVLSSPECVTDALCRLGSRLSHFLVDEFQDTSNEQWTVLHSLVHEALSRGGSFTWVGDVKQSIYGWRGGDPSLFDKALHDSELRAIVPDALPKSLKDNWRSLPAIVDHTNSFFEPLAKEEEALKVAALILGKDANQDVTQETAAHLVAAFREGAQNCKKTDGAPGYVSACEVDAGEDDDFSEAVCRLVLDNIGQRRPWSDILILVRKNDYARELAEKLGNYRIPVITESGLLLRENALIAQTVAFLEFLNNPDDNSAFWNFINGEIFRLHPFASTIRDLDLADWAAGRDRFMPLFRKFREDFPEIWKTAIRPFYHRPLLMTAYDVVKEWYKRMDVERRYPDDLTMLDRFLETLHISENRNQATINGFLEYWRANSEEEKAPMPEKMDAVRIITIHKAKGLQAPVVIVPDPAYPIIRETKPAALEAGGVRVAASLAKDVGAPHGRAVARQGLELLNLVYVAYTRAQEELHILLRKKNNPNQLRQVLDYLQEKADLELPYTIGELPLAQPGHKPCFVEIKKAVEPEAPETEQPDWKPMSWMPNLKIYHTELASTKLTPTQRGTVMHSCLERMGYEGDAGEIAEAALKAGVSGSAIFVPESELAPMRAALEWFAEEMPGRDWLGRGFREQPLVNAEGELLRADLIVPESWGPLVVDYKTGEPGSGDIAQIREYMQILAESGQFPGRPCGLLVYLDKRSFVKVQYGGIDLSKAADRQIPAESSANLPQFP